MELRLRVISGPHEGKEFGFAGRDTFLVGRSKDAHHQLPADDPYFSRRHFLLEINPPRCRITDLNSRNGTRLNGVPVRSAEVADGDEITAGHTTFKVQARMDPDEVGTLAIVAATPPQPTEAYRTEAAPGYVVEGVIGEGGMGVVYRARRDRDGKTVALKTIRPDAAATPRDVQRFLRECEILATLDHPHVVRFEDAGERNGLIYLAMEFVDGCDLVEWQRTLGRVEVRTAVRVACQVLAGLAHAHGRGFVHRDIKPRNVLIGRDGKRKVAKLADFGLARAFQSSRVSGLTLQGEFGGTPAYMAPEQVTHYRDVTTAADLYSTAATLYQLLTGRPIFDLPADLAGRIAMVVTGTPTPIIVHRPDLPPGLAAAIHTALSREPENRFPDATAFAAALRPFA